MDVFHEESGSRKYFAMLGEEIVRPEMQRFWQRSRRLAVESSAEEHPEDLVSVHHRGNRVNVRRLGMDVTKLAQFPRHKDLKTLQVYIDQVEVGQGKIAELAGHATMEKILTS